MSSDKVSKIDAVFPKLMAATRAAAGLASNDVTFYKSMDQTISSQSDEVSERLLKLINQVILQGDGDANEIEGSTIKDSWSVISNVLDGFLEKADIAFDELKNGGKNNQNKASDGLTYLDDAANIHSNNVNAKRLEKPQLKFRTKIDNTETHPFRPLLTSKPNAIVPYQETFTLIEEDENNPAHYNQPYETEILQQEYNPLILEKSDPIDFKDWDTTDAIWVDNKDELSKMLKCLEKATEIAVDLEHHDYRSYYGLVCLMQISTRDQDWLIDTLVLREDLQVLNSVFTNPKVTKVFHGAFMDIIWLQRDLGLYVVSLFDTYHASRLLGFPKHGLSYLLERFAHFKTSKKYQLADWRIRPLTKPMRLYARSDTHFLLYIYDNLKNMLLEQNKLDKVLFESRNVAIRRFEYSTFRPKIPNQYVVSPIEKAEPWKNLLYQYNLASSRASIVEALWNWRDHLARVEDESPRYVMPNQLLVSLASLAPTTAAGVLSASNIISESVRKNCKVIGDLIASCLKKAEIEDFKLYDSTEKQYKKENDVVSLEKVLKSEKLFNVISKSYSVNPEGISFNQDSSFFSANMVDGSNSIFNVDKSDQIPSSLRERGSLIEIKLNQIKGAQVNEVVDDKVDIDNEKSAEPEDEEKEASSMFDDKDDVIVIKVKKSQQQKNKAPKSSDSDETKEAFDYSKAEKVINPTTSSKFKGKNDKKRPSSTFDPYSKESEGPRPAKKQSMMHAGKTSSFVNRKKTK